MGINEGDKETHPPEIQLPSWKEEEVRTHGAGAYRNPEMHQEGPHLGAHIALYGSLAGDKHTLAVVPECLEPFSTPWTDY